VVCLVSCAVAVFSTTSDRHSRVVARAYGKSRIRDHCVIPRRPLCPRGTLHACPTCRNGRVCGNAAGHSANWRCQTARWRTCGGTGPTGPDQGADADTSADHGQAEGDRPPDHQAEANRGPSSGPAATRVLDRTHRWPASFRSGSKARARRRNPTRNVLPMTTPHLRPGERGNAPRPLNRGYRHDTRNLEANSRNGRVCKRRRPSASGIRGAGNERAKASLVMDFVMNVPSAGAFVDISWTDSAT
jgi:hypothetical protein